MLGAGRRGLQYDFQAFRVVCSSPWQARVGVTKGTSLYEVVQREGSEALWVDKESKMELSGAQEMLWLLPCFEDEPLVWGLGAGVKGYGQRHSLTLSSGKEQPQPTSPSSSCLPLLRKRQDLDSQSVSELFHFLFYPGAWAGDRERGARLSAIGGYRHFCTHQRVGVLCAHPCVRVLCMCGLGRALNICWNLAPGASGSAHAG